MKNATKAIIAINMIVAVEFVFCIPDTSAQIAVKSKITITNSSLLNILSNFISIGLSGVPDALPTLVMKKLVANIIVVTNKRDITDADTGLSSIKPPVADFTDIPIIAVSKKITYNTLKNIPHLPVSGTSKLIFLVACVIIIRTNKYIKVNNVIVRVIIALELYVLCRKFPGSAE